MGSRRFESEGWMTRRKYDEYDQDEFQELFWELVEQAAERYGHSEGYSGAINMKDGYMQCGVMTQRQYREAMEWWNEVGAGSAPPAFLREKGVVDEWKAADDKWSPACAVVIKDEKRDATIVTGRFIADKGYLSPDEREEKRYVVNYELPGRGGMEERFDKIPEAWDFAKRLVDEELDAELESIEHSYTYALPEVKEKTRQGQEVKVRFFGSAPY
jgi:hypothetical protein